MRMLYDYVLLKKYEKESPVLRANRSDFPEKGEVLAVGPGDPFGVEKPMEGTTVRPGDKVYFIRDRAAEVQIGDKKLYVLKEKEIYGVLEEGEC